MKISQRFKLNSIYGRKAVKRIKDYSFSDDEFNYLINNYSLFKKIYKDNKNDFLPDILSLYSRYKSNLEVILTTISQSNNPNTYLSIDTCENILMKRIKNREPIAIADFSELKKYIPEIFDSEYPQEIKNIITKIIETKEVLTDHEMILLLKQNIGLANFSKEIFSGVFSDAINSFGLAKVKEVINTINIDENIEYNLMWMLNRQNENVDERTKTDKYVLDKLGIQSLPELILINKKYNGLPFDIKNAMTDEEVAEFLKIAQVLEGDIDEANDYASSIPYPLVKELHNSLRETYIKEYIINAYKCLYRSNISQKKCFDKHIVFLNNDISNNVPTSFNALLNGNAETNLALIEQPKEIIQILQCLQWSPHDDNNYPAYNKLKALVPGILRLDYDKQEYLISNCYSTIQEWAKVFDGKEFDINIVEALPLSMSSIVKEKYGEYQSLFKMPEIADVFNRNSDFSLEYSRAILGMAITFGLFENDSNAIKNIQECFIFFNQAEKNAGDNLSKLRAIFSRVSVGLDPDFLVSLKKDYKSLMNYKERELANMFDNLREAQVYNSSLKFKTVQALIDYSMLDYKGVNPSFAYASGYMKTFGVKRSDYDKVEIPFEKGAERASSSIPYIDGKINSFEYKTIKLWDSYLMYFDMKNGFVKLSEQEKQKILTSNHIRIIEVKDEQGITVDIIEVKRTANNTIVVSSLNNEVINPQVEQAIVSEYQKIMGMEQKIITTNTIENYHDEYTGDAKYIDQPDIITGRLLTAPEFEKVKKIIETAFGVNLENSTGVEAISKIKEFNENRTIILGRDWIIVYEQKEDGLNIEEIARFNKNDQETSIGRTEMKHHLARIIASTSQTVSVAAMNTSYYSFAKMAMNGEILITQDRLDKMIVEDNPMFNQIVTVNSFYDDNGNINLGFAEGEHNISNYPHDSFGKGTQKVNFVKFISTKQGLTKEQQETLEIQKQIYTKIVNMLDQQRDKDRHENSVYLAENANHIYDTFLQDPNFAGIKNLKVYSLSYLWHLQHKYKLIKDAGPGFVSIEESRIK